MTGSAINITILSSVFVQIIVNTMDDKTTWDDQEKASNALLCLFGFGVGEIVGLQRTCCAPHGFPTALSCSSRGRLWLTELLLADPANPRELSDQSSTGAICVRCGSRLCS